ncbi:MAG: hypothetical protein ACN6O7_09130 [Sphingobacterium sp.]
MPYEDENIGKILDKYNTQFSNPHNLRDFIADTNKGYVDYVAVFIPGGHGAMLGLPENNDVKELISLKISSHCGRIFNLSKILKVIFPASSSSLLHNLFSGKVENKGILKK